VLSLRAAQDLRRNQLSRASGEQAQPLRAATRAALGVATMSFLAAGAAVDADLDVGQTAGTESSGRINQ
jgi:hypothetical protein